VLSTFLASRSGLAEAQHSSHSALAAYDVVLQKSPDLAEACLGEGSCPASLAGTPRHSTGFGRAICKTTLVMDQERSCAFAKIFPKCKN